jgi:ferredoxin/DMSO/TMAO reductase YedYZ heme-binding membrane subunit
MRTAQESVHLVAATVGFVSFAALWGGTLWGTVLRSGWATSRLRHQTVHSIHMHLILLGLTLGIVHGLAQLAAPGAKVRAIDAVVPFIDRADPVGVGLGVLALEIMIASALSVLIQRKLGYARWRALHSLGYLAFTMVAAHLLISGAEVSAAAARTAIAAAWAVVVVAGVSTVAPVARLPRAVLDRLSRRHRAEEVTVSVDPGKCGSFGFCEQEAPAIFTLRSDQRLAYRSVVSSEQAEAAMRAAVVCPARAIKLGRLPATVVVSQPGADTSTVSPLAASLSPPRADHTGSQPRVSAHTGSQPPVPAGHTGSQPRVPVAAADPRGGPLPHDPRMIGLPPRGMGADPHTGGLPPVAAGADPRAGSRAAADPRAGSRAAAGPHTGPMPGAGPAHTGPSRAGHCPRRRR